jgi:hypothetical protein
MGQPPQRPPVNHDYFTCGVGTLGVGDGGGLAGLGWSSLSHPIAPIRIISSRSVDIGFMRAPSLMHGYRCNPNAASGGLIRKIEVE